MSSPTDPNVPAPRPCARRDDERIELLPCIPFFLVHLLALGVLFTTVRWYDVALCVVLYYARMFGLTAGYHRYFAHRAYKTTRAFQFALAWLGTTASQKGVLWWAGHHRHHHRFSDTDDDIHSPSRRGFFWSHVGWILCRRYDRTPVEGIRDFERFPELRWLNRLYLVPVIALAVATYLIGGWPTLFWAFFLSTVILWHGTFTINSLSHLFGRQRYETGDTSRNSFLLALVTLGEGWHNNHHYYQRAVNQGFYWWEIDVTYYLLKAFSWIGLVWDLKTPPRHVLESGRVEAAAAPALVAPSAQA